jgi:hypothetical protein
MFWFSGGKESVTIYSGKTNKKLCEIQCPQKWYYPKGVIYYSRVWKDPEAIKKWAWRQAYLITKYLNDIGVTRRGDLLPPTFRCQCLVCGQDTVRASFTHWRWSRHYKFTGFACFNKECNMFRAEIPKVLCSYMHEMPIEYLPAGWAKMIEPEI